jgi:lysophospholipase L1-like esterase
MPAGSFTVQPLGFITISYTSGSTAFTATSGTLLAQADVGREINAEAAGIPALTTIVSVSADGLSGVLSSAATVSGSNVWARIDRLSGEFRYYGFPNAARAGSSDPLWKFVKFTNMEFSHYGSKFEIQTISNAANAERYKMWVDIGDGWKAVTADPVAGPTGANTLVWIMYDFGTTAHRRIRIESNGWRISGVRRGPLDTIYRGDSSNSVRATFVGDSNFSNGWGTVKAGFTSPWGYVHKALGWGDPINKSQAGTGYLADGKVNWPTFDILRNRIPDIISTDPDVVVVSLGVNDASYTKTQVQAESLACFQLLKSGLPYSRIYIVGPTNRPANAAGLLSISDGIRISAATAGVPYIDPHTGGVWSADGSKVGEMTGKWVVGVQTDTTNNGGVFFHTDNLHYTQAGADYLGRRIASAIQSIDQHATTGRVNL